MTSLPRDRTTVLAGLLLIVGLLQMTGDLLGVRALKGIGAATMASPAPKVFSAVRGYETYSTRFFIEWDDRLGNRFSMAMTPQLYSLLRGPYARRNAYGAVLAYGPVLPESLRGPVLRYALCGRAPLLREMGLDPDRMRGHARVRYLPRDGKMPAKLPTLLTPPCK